MLPKRIGRYEILGQLAAGGMAEILLARLWGPADFKRAVVIKRILRSYAAQTSFVKMFLDEARIVAQLQHPNVVHVQELGEHEGDPFLVMEYVAGENAASLQKRVVASGEALDPRLAAYVVAEICAGLHAAHELASDDGRPQNLVHRDVSPHNVLVAYDGHVKLVDFGVALVEQRDTRTEPGEVKGKFDYMSPEQMTGKPLDRRSDLFSAGIVLYELSTGRRLFKRQSHAKTIEAICREPIVPPSRVLSASAPPYPPKLEAIVVRALSKDPSGRYASAAEMRKDLMEVVRDLVTPGDSLAERMRRLFFDRIAEKEDMLRRVSAGDELSHVPAGETDETVEIPAAPSMTLVDPHAFPVPPSLAPPSPASTHLLRVAVIGAAAIAVAIVAIATLIAMRGLRRVDPPPPTLASAPAATVTEGAPGAEPGTAPVPPLPPSDVVVVRVETKPPGAHVVVRGEDRGASPVDVMLPRGPDAVLVEVSRRGYASIEHHVTPDADQKLFLALTPSRARSGRPTPRRSPKASAPAPASASGFRRFD